MSRTLKNFLTFFLVLVLTVVTVTALSLATQAKTETAAAEYTERLETVQKEETAKLTAVVPEKESLNFWACAGCFLLLLSIPAGGGILYIRARRKGRSPEKDAANVLQRAQEYMNGIKLMNEAIVDNITDRNKKILKKLTKKV